MILYQYKGQLTNETSLGYLRNLIEKGELKFTKPSDFNDPFDCCPTQVSEIPAGAFPHAVGDMMNKSIQSASSLMHGIACFTPHPNKMLMWSHYGDQHRSVCVGFDTEILLEKPPLNSEGNPLYEDIVEVVYTENRPDGDSTDQYFHKSTEWHYEEERRIISGAKKGSPIWGEGVWPIPIESIKEIVLGARMPGELETKVVALVKSANPVIEIKKAVLHMHTFEILIESFEGQPNVGQMQGAICDPNGKWRNT
jgi:hypothetical protein